jgi:flagellar biosynthesis/type III secretory pathway protein FliH
MSALIKSGATPAIRAFALHEAPPAAAPAETETDRLRTEIARLGKALADARAEADSAILEAHEKGRRTGLAEAEASEAERLAALRDGMTQALADFEARLDLLDGLAPQLARAALGKLFDDSDQWSAMAEAMLARQLRLIRRSTLVAIRVSPKDFTDTAALRALETGELRIEVDPDLRAGACRIECKLGQIDLDVRDQWETLARLLAEMGADA